MSFLISIKYNSMLIEKKMTLSIETLMSFDNCNTFYLFEGLKKKPLQMGRERIFVSPMEG